MIMKLSEELLWRGFYAETTFQDPAELDQTTHKFYMGADPSAASLTIGNLATLMMCAVFARHGYEPHLLVGGATGQIGDPKDTAERELKPLAEVAKNKAAIARQLSTILARATASDATLPVLDNYDWFKQINYLDFLREIGKNFSMTQLLDRQFVQARIGAGGSGMSYAEFSYTLIQGYDFLHLYREYGIDLQLCGADQFGNCASGMHLIRTLENAQAHIWSAPLIIDPVSGRKFGKSEGNAVWLDANLTSIFDYYQFWLGQPDQGVENFLKIYTLLDQAEIADLMQRHGAAPEQRLAQKALALGTTSIVHGAEAATAVAALSETLFAKTGKAIDLKLAAQYFPSLELADLASSASSGDLASTLVDLKLANSKNEARKFLTGQAITVIAPDHQATKASLDTQITQPCLLRRGKNKFAVIY